MVSNVESDYNDYKENEDNVKIRDCNLNQD